MLIMSRRREVGEHLKSLLEIRGIMNAMKNLSLIELRKLSRFAGNQRRALETIEKAASDFFSFHPKLLGSSHTGREILVVIGSERGLCGDFNEVILSRLGSEIQSTEVHPILFVVGSKLAAKIQASRQVTSVIGGASVAEELQPTLTKLVQIIEKLQSQQADQRPRLGVIYHAEEGVQRLDLFPTERFRAVQKRFSHPPLLNQKPTDFAVDLLKHFLFVALNQVFYSSLMVENRRRLQHLDGAIQRLDKDVSKLKLRYNSLRQEEITEEIEIVMLSAEELSRGFAS